MIMRNFLLGAFAVSLASCASAPLSVGSAASVPVLLSTQEFPEQGYAVTTESLTQPVDHRDPSKGSFEQQIFVLKPHGAAPDARVYFVLGNETDTTAEGLRALYRAYGSPRDTIFLIAEHRGYGQSITDADQSRPAYVTIEQTLKDYDRVVTLYKKRFGGVWIGGGYSYGGSLVIQFAHDHPKHFAAVIASSPPIDLSFTTPEYARGAEANLGPSLAEKMRAHMAALKPAKLYDDTWLARERLLGLSAGLSQMPELRPLIPLVDKLAALPTAEFVAALPTSLPPAAMTAVDAWARNRVPTGTLPAAEARKGTYNWYTWKYQQCTETGTFFTTGLFPVTREDHIADCRASFGEEPVYASAKPWPVAAMLGKLATPILVVTGGRDPWFPVGVQPGHGFANIEHIHFADALHCPDRDPSRGKGVFEKAVAMASVQ